MTQAAVSVTVETPSSEWLSSVDRACASIAPTWPLDQFIAVNPFWEHRQQPINEVAARLAVLNRVTMVSTEVLAETIGQDVAQGLQHRGAQGAESVDSGNVESWMNLSDLADQQRDLGHKMSWRAEILEQISRFSARYFAAREAVPACPDALYESWLKSLRHDTGIAVLMGEPGITAQFAGLPDRVDELLATASTELAISVDIAEEYALALLLDVKGWAAWVAYLRWQASLRGEAHRLMLGFLAIRLAWELLLSRHMASHHPEGWKRMQYAWRSQQSRLPEMHQRHREAQQPHWEAQRTVERHYQQHIAAGLLAAEAVSQIDRPVLQAVFCIDVRSEPFRRHLEAQHPGVETKGFAGFFGLPIDFQSAGATSLRPQLPGLLRAALTVEETDPRTGAVAQRQRGASWSDIGEASPAMFGLVEAAGLGYAWRLLAQSFLARHKPADTVGAVTLVSNGVALDVTQRSALAAKVLGAMGLTDNFADAVMLVGHGSSTANNPHATGLDCGACGGQTGEVNVRVLAELLNDRDVRNALSEQGISIPDSTRFFPALHDTTVDEVRSLGGHQLPLRVREWLVSAGAGARRDRLNAPAAHDAEQLAKAARVRACDWSEVRPEWGLANNAAFVAAPRSRTRHLNLGGRVFLHDYEASRDADGSLLELILTAPMVVANWINMQYNASVMDQGNYGSGSKTLHNVVSGSLGVLSGQGGDLRIGLPLQSVHDGERWMHTPQRLSVFVEADRAAIDRVYEDHAVVRDLVDNEWLFLFQIGDDGVWQKSREQWSHIAAATQQ